MPRRVRLMLPDVPLHIIQRGNNRQICFFSDHDYQAYLDWLRLYAFESDCRVHAYVLMTNHIHLLISCSANEGISTMMKALGQRYAQYVNRTKNRSGSLWQGRFRSCPTQQERYFFACQRYIELNPVRAGMVRSPADYRWSSYQSNALGVGSDLITPHPLYDALGIDDESRRTAYRDLFKPALEVGMLAQIRQALNGNFVLGNAQFAEEFARGTGQRTTPAYAGRPENGGMQQARLRVAPDK